MFFRHNDDFTAGLYSQFTPIFLQLARFLPTDYVRHRSYADVHSGGFSTGTRDHFRLVNLQKCD